MPTYKVKAKITREYDGFIEAADTQEAVNKVLFPHTVDENSHITLTQPISSSDWLATNQTFDTEITKLEKIGETENTNISPIPDAVSPLST